MRTVLKNVNVWLENSFSKGTVIIDDGRIADIVSPSVPVFGDTVFEFDNACVFPGFTDVHVHLREPGFSYKENIASGTRAAARGGFTNVCSMPNLKPVPDSLESLNVQLEIIKSDAAINVYPFGSITVGQRGLELSDMENMAEFVAGFSDDGKGVQDKAMMEKAMEQAAILGKIISAHCEDELLLAGGYIHDGIYAHEHGHKGICSKSEWGPIERDIELAARTRCAYHVCHISCKESVELIRDAKKRGINITCETAPHYLLLDDSMLENDGRFKMNPPIRELEDRQALIEGIKDGTIDMIATDHAPHSIKEKAGGLKNSLNGITGIELSFPVLYTGLVKKGILTLEKLVELMHVNPMKRFGLGTELKIGNPADITVFDLNSEYVIRANDLLSKGKSTPFDGWKVRGKCLLTICEGKTVWRDEAVRGI
jgi:dihydroorotase